MSKKYIWTSHIKKFKKINNIELGKSWSSVYLSDPKTLLFCLSRYKFVAKMLEGKKKVFEVGCGEAFGSPLVSQEVQKLVCVDIVKEVIESNKKRLDKFKNISFSAHDFDTGSLKEKYDAAYLLDVLEHIEPKKADNFIKNIKNSLKKNSVLITGVPSISAHKYASKNSRKNHINMMNQKQLKTLLSKYFDYNFVFGMNDEVLHTGYAPMSHYIFVLSANRK